MKLTGKKLYRKNCLGTSEIGLIVFAYSDLNPKQKKLYEKAGVSGDAYLVSKEESGWDIEKRRDKEYLKEIILDNFPNFNFDKKLFWFYQESDLQTSEYLFVKQRSNFIKNE